MARADAAQAKQMLRARRIRGHAFPVLFHPDYTVGPGIAPGLLTLQRTACKRSRARRFMLQAPLPPVGNRTPP